MIGQSCLCRGYFSVLSISVSGPFCCRDCCKEGILKSVWTWLEGSSLPVVTCSPRNRKDAKGAISGVSPPVGLCAELWSLAGTVYTPPFVQTEPNRPEEEVSMAGATLESHCVWCEAALCTLLCAHTACRVTPGRHNPPPTPISSLYCTGPGNLRSSVACPILLLPSAHSSARFLRSHGGMLWTPTAHAPWESHSQRYPPWGKLPSQLRKVSNHTNQRGRVRCIGNDISAAIPQGLIQIDPVCFSWKFQLMPGMRFCL